MKLEYVNSLYPCKYISILNTLNSSDLLNHGKSEYTNMPYQLNHRQRSNIILFHDTITKSFCYQNLEINHMVCCNSNQS